MVKLKKEKSGSSLIWMLVCTVRDAASECVRCVCGLLGDSPCSLAASVCDRRCSNKRNLELRLRQTDIQR